MTPKSSSQSLLGLNLLSLAAVAASFLFLVTYDIERQTGVFAGAYPTLLLFVGITIAGILVISGFRYPSAGWVKTPILLALPVIGLQAYLIAVRSTQGGAFWFSPLFITSGMITLGLLLVTAVTSMRIRTEPVKSLIFETEFGRLSLWVLGITFLSLVTGTVETAQGSVSCGSWPLCEGFALPTDPAGWLLALHRVSVGVNLVFLARMGLVAWKKQRYQTGILVLTTSSIIFYTFAALIGALFSTQYYSLSLVALHSVAANLLWVVLSIVVVMVGVAGRTDAEERMDAFQTQSIRVRIKDFIALTKPIIVLLLLVTTFAGMIVGAQGWPAFDIIFWTLLGGGMAAGGSAAINQYIDRELDANMKRTAKRPLVTGRLSPAEGLAFGVGLCLTSFYFLAVFVNLLAAFLSVLGMVYYVWFYSIFLKRKTVQNIVIGGGAGAIPPMVGWAAATGEITLASIMLFLIIFFWTPPHFWALALVRLKDYTRGGIPMLPVVKGEKETLRQIMIYTVELIVLTLLAPLVGVGSLIYFISAAVLGLWLLSIAWRLWKSYTPKLAWKMYRYSSMYLAFLFLAMVVDALI